MNAHPGRTARAAACALAIALAAAAARAQEPPRLDALLRELAATDADAWKARMQSIEAAAAKARADAATLRKEADADAGNAAGKRDAADALRAELDKLGKLRELLTGLRFRDPAGAEGQKASPQGALERALAQLQAAKDEAWKARTAAITGRAEAHDGKAKQLDEQAKARRAKADGKDGEAKALTRELDKLTELRKVVKVLRLDLLATAPTAAATEKPAAAMAAAAPKPKGDAKPDAKPKGDAKPKPEPKGDAKPEAKPKGDTKPKPEPKGDTKPDAKPKGDAKPKPEPKGDEKPKPEPKPKAEPETQPKSPPPAAKPAAEMAAASAGDDGVEPDDRLVTYDDHVYPIFDEYCITCHEAADPSGGLDLETHAAALQGGSSGKTLSPGNPNASRLYLLVSHQEKPTMPPDEPRIDKELIEKIRTWIAQGAPKDLDQARALSKKRAIERRKAAEEAAARELATPTAEAVMPGELPRVNKAYPARPGALRALAAAPAAPLLAVPGFGQVLLLHQDGLRELGVLEFPYGQVERLQFTADGRRLLAAGGTPGKAGGAVLYDVATGSQLGAFGEARDVLMAAAASPRGRLVAVGGTKKQVRVIRVEDGRELWQQTLDDWVTALAFSANGELLASADRSGVAEVREAWNGREVHTLKPADGLCAQLAFSPDSELLAAVGADRAVALYRMKDGRQLFSQKRHNDQVLCVDWRSGSRLVTSGADGRLFHWRTDGRREAELPRVGEWVYGVAASADGARVFTADWQGRLRAIDVKTRKTVAEAVPLLVTQ